MSVTLQDTHVAWNTIAWHRVSCIWSCHACPGMLTQQAVRPHPHSACKTCACLTDCKPQRTLAGVLNMHVLLCRESSRNLSLSSQSLEQSALKELPEGPARQRSKGISVTAGAAQLPSPHQQPGLVTGPGTGGLAPSIMRKHPFQPPNKLPPARTEQHHSSNRPPAQHLSPMAAAAQAARLAFGPASSSSSSRGSAAPPAAGASHEHDPLQGLQGTMQHPRISPQRSDPSAQADTPLPSESRQLGLSKQAVPSGPRTVQSGAPWCCSISPGTILSAWITLKVFKVTQQGFCLQGRKRTRCLQERTPPQLVKRHLL